MATRRSDYDSGEVRFDYGAQYFTASEKEFRAQVDAWMNEGIVREWSRGFYTDSAKPRIDKVPRYIGVGGMMTITRHFSRNIDIHQSSKVIGIERTGDMWSLFTEDKEVFKTRFLVLTPPVPQCLDLLQNSGISIEEQVKTRLDRIEYGPCIALMCVCKGESSVPDPGGMWFERGPLSWIADNKKKGVSKDITTVTVHASPRFSRDKWTEKDSEIFSEIVNVAGKYIGSEITDYQIHRWRYSRVTATFDKPFAFISDPGPLYIAGDAFVSPKVEGGYMSGLATAGHIISADHRL